MTTKLTPAAALEDIQEMIATYVHIRKELPLEKTTIKTIQEALAIYDKIQSGEWKALARDTTFEMDGAGYKALGWNDGSRHYEVIYKAMWDAASAQPLQVFGIDVVIDPTMPPDTFEIRNKPGTITNTPRADKTEGRG